MKKSIFLTFVFLFSLFIISHNVIRNTKIENTIQEYKNIQHLSYQLEIIVQQQQMLLRSLEKEINNDKIVSVNKQFIQQFEYFEKESQRLNDIKLSNVIFDIKQKNFVLENIYEDIKTDHAVIKNSRIWLVKSYTKYLSELGNSSEDKAFLEYIFKVVNANSNHISVEFKQVDLIKDGAENLNRHLGIIFEKQNNLIALHKDLQLNDITQDFDKIVLLTLKKLNKLQTEIKEIIFILLGSVIFLLLFGVMVYIQELLTSREAQRLKNDLQQFVDALDASAIVSKTDTKGFITYVNEKFTQVSGYTQEELLNQPHNIVRHPDMPSEVFKELWENISNKKIFKGIIKNKTKDGGVYYVDTAVTPILDVDGEIKEYLAVRYEITNLVESRDAALQSERAKGEFLSNMSHELRTPLNSINGFSTILTRLITDEKQLGYLQNILDSSDNLIGLINDILDLSKLQSGKFSLDYHDFNLDEKLHLLLSRFDSLLSKSDLKIQKDFNNTDVTLHGDWLRISQVITNFISNAIKFSPDNSVIELEVYYRDEELKIAVIDYGIGMSEEAQEKIFKPFEQADSSTTRQYGGTGLGLSIALNLIEQMKAKLKLQSKEGRGSTFEVIIPLKEAKNLIKSDIVQEDEEIEPLNGHILIAEDNKTNQMLISILIEEFGLTFTMANDGVEAISAFEKEKFDLVLMDENMPNMNGLEAMKQIYERNDTSVPIIALTANAMSGDRDKFLEAGMRDYVAKPIDDKELYRVIKKHLG